MSDRDLKLNGLSRYAKQSPHLVLEEYGHCEVPAGCGGVVLRWRNPDQPIPIVVRFFSSNGKLDYQGFDGDDTHFRSKRLVSYGAHALTLILRDVDPKFAMVLLAAKLDEQYTRILQPQGDTTILSLPDGTWKYTLVAPEGDAWQLPDFDDRDWLPMVEKPINSHSKQYGGDIRFWTQDILDQGAKPLGIDTRTSLMRQMRAMLGKQATLPAIYVRKTFSLEKNNQLG